MEHYVSSLLTLVTREVSVAVSQTAQLAKLIQISSVIPHI